jgi:starch synthase
MGLEWLYQHTTHKSIGIINGIDAQVWNPETDELLAQKLKKTKKTAFITTFKNANKADICTTFGLDNGNETNNAAAQSAPHFAPLVVFVGRLVAEKGADLLPDIIARVLHSGLQVNFAILGSGNAYIADQLDAIARHYPSNVGVQIAYNEALAHKLYAAADFLLMPSRIEPCGLNQLYAMRYGALPIVRKVGGLKDTVPDIGEIDGSGRGITFLRCDAEDAYWAIYRAVELYKQPEKLLQIRQKVMEIDFSWQKTVQTYKDIYANVLAS